MNESLVGTVFAAFSASPVVAEEAFKIAFVDPLSGPFAAA